jgi:hypothetical protein
MLDKITCLWKGSQTSSMQPSVRQPLIAGVIGAGFIALTGDLPGTIGYLKSCGPVVTIPLKATVAFPLVYHYIAGELALLHTSFISYMPW